MAGGFFVAIRHTFRRLVAWTTEVERPQCPKPECEGKEAVPTGKVRIFPPLPLMNAGADSWPMVNAPFIMREHKCKGCSDTFWDWR